MTLRETMDLSDVALMLGAKPETVAQLARRGEIPGTQIGKGWIFLRENILEYLRERIMRDTLARRAAECKQPEAAQESHALPVAVAMPRPATRRKSPPPLPELSSPAHYHS